MIGENMMYRCLGDLKTIIAQSDWPVNFLSPENLPVFLEKIYVLDYETSDSSGNYFVRFWLAIEGEVAIALPGLDGCKFVFGGNTSGYTLLTASFIGGTENTYMLEGIRAALRFDKSVLKPAAFEGEKPSQEFVEIEVEGSISITSDFDIDIDGFDAFKLTPAEIGDSGVIIAADDVKFDLSRTTTLSEVKSAGFDESFIGVYIGKARLQLPKELSSFVPKDIFLKNTAIGSGGVSGEVYLEYKPNFNKKTKKFTGPGSGELFGIPFGLEKLDIKLKQNALKESKITGQLLLPFFEKRVSVEIGLSLDGGFSTKLTGVVESDDSMENGLLTLKKPGLLEITVDSLGFEVQDGVFTAKLSGEIKPLIGNLDWPAFEVNELTIDSKGNVRLDGGWLNLRKQYSLDFYGFKFEITKLGFGKTDDGGKWIGFSGSLKLIDGLPAGGSVEGLRITWYEDGGSPKITLNGVGIEFEVPDVLRFKGEVAYRELPGDIHRFDGAIKLELTTLDIDLDGQLVIGIDKVEGYTFFAIYLGVELPAGIPLWSTGLALYGVAGLFALQMKPDKKEQEEWYSLDRSKSWYHRTPVGAFKLKKWKNVQDSLGLGAGITIGTISDNGYIISGKTTLAIVFPGPQIFIEGQADILKKRPELKKPEVEPLFRALAVLDARAGTFLIGLDAQYKYGKGGELIEIGGSAEAFFNFNDASDWHLYLGQKEPREKRIHARILKLFGSSSYFMLDANSLAFGSWVGYGNSWKFGPLRVTLEAWMEYNVGVSWSPPHLHGDISVHGKAELAVFWFDLGLSLDARLAADVFDPFHLKGELSVGINLPWPLPDFSVGITLEWGPRPDRPPLPLPLKEVAVEHLKVAKSWPLPRGGAQPLLLPNYDSNGDGFWENPKPDVAVQEAAKCPLNAPVVPLDCRPQITFARPVNDDAKIGVNPQPADPEYEQIGDPEKGEGPVKVRYGLKEISLAKWVDEKDPWEEVAWSRKKDKKNLYGSWAPIPAMPDKGGTVVAQNKLRLWSKTPFDFTEHGGSAWDEWFTDRFENYPCINIPQDKEICYDFDHLEVSGQLMPPWHHPTENHLIFYWTGKGAPSITSLSAPVDGRTKALCYADPQGVSAKTETKISLPQPAKKVTLIASDEEVVEVTGYSPEGKVFGPFYGGKPGVQSVVLTGTDIANVTVRGYLRTCIIAVCITVGLSKDEIARRQEMEKHLKDELVRWGQEDDILEPYTTYRLKVITTLKTKDFPYDSDFNTERELTEFVYFCTEGPPGLTRLSLPEGTANEEEAALRKAGKFIVVDDKGKVREINDLKDEKEKPKKNERLVLKSELNDLTCYVHQTIPATVPPPGKQPSLPRPVYRAYDIGVEFNVNYVDLMYRIARRDLGLYLYNNNNRPVRDAEGRLIVLSNRWGQAETVRLTETDIRTITLFNSSDCAPLPEDKPRNKTLNSSEANQVLDGDTVYEARLVPLLFHEEFADDLAGWEQLDADNNVVMHNTPSDWKGHKTLKGDKATANKNVAYLDGKPDLSKLTPKRDIIIFDEDERRAAGRYKIVSFDNKAKTVTLDGTPKLKTGSSKWVIPSALVQTSNIWGSPFDKKDPVKPGTMLLRADDPRLPKDNSDQPRCWTDYRFSVYLRTTNDDDAIGVVFRCPDSLECYPKNYYLFTMAREGRYRRLVRIMDGIHTILAEDDFIYQEDRDYLVTIEAIGASIRVYQNGAPVFSVNDSTFKRGTIGFHTWGNMGARFSSPCVDDYRKQAPIVYRFNFTTSHFSNFFHQLHSYQDETWLHFLPGGADVKTLLGKGVSPTSKPSDDEARNYAALVSQLFAQAPRQKPAQVQVTQIKQTKEAKDAIALLVESPEPIDWKRTDLEALYTKRTAPKPTIPGVVKLTDVTFGKAKPNEESVSLLLRDTADLTDHRIEYWKMPGPMAEPSDVVLFKDEFDRAESGMLFREELGPNSLDHYSIVDEGSELGSSRWLYERSPSGGYIIQTSPIYGGSVTGGDREQPGTVAVTGAADWANVRIRAKLRSESSGAVGLVFGYQGRGDWCRLSMDDKGRCLVRKANGKLKVLWEDKVPCELSRSYSIIIEAFGDRLLGYVDQMLLFSVKADQIATGQVGFHSWKNSAAIVDALTVESLEKAPLLWQPAFADLDEWEMFDDPNAVEGPSAWKVEEGVLIQSSNIHVPDTVLPSIWLRAGTYALGGDETWEDVQISVRLRSDQDGVVGVMFRAAPRFGPAGEELGHDYYRLFLDYKAGVWRLIKVADGILGPLAWGKVQLKIGQTYDLTIRAVGSELSGYLEGAQLFTQYDGDLKNGQVGLDSWANPGARFERLLVTDQTRYVGQWVIKDEGTVNAPSVWRIANGAFLQTSDISGGGPPDYPGTYAITGNPNWTDYRLRAQMRSDDDGAIGVIFRYVDGDNYYRLLLDQQRNHWWLIKKENGNTHDLGKGAKAYTVGESFTLTVDAIGNRLVGHLGDDRLFDIIDNTHSTGRIGVCCWDNNGVRIERVEVHKPPLEAYALFRDRFADGSTAGWSFIDEGTKHGPAKWDIFEGVLRQTSNTHTPEPAQKLDKKGTYALCGDPKWSDVIISVRLESHDDDAIGLMFRYKDKDNYLRFSMDNQRHYCRLVKNLGGNFSLLWSSHFVYEPKRAYNVTIVAIGKTLRGYLDGVPMFKVEVEDKNLLTGRIAGYCWGNDDTRISQVRVYPAHLAFTEFLYTASFDTPFLPPSWKFITENGKESSAHWKVSKGRLIHQSRRRGEDAAPLEREKSARIALMGDESWTDYRVSVQLESDEDGDCGILLRYADTKNFYGVFLSTFQRGKRIVRLTAKHNGKTRILEKTQVPYSKGQEHILTVDCVGPTLRAYLDGVELFVVEDDHLSAGRIGLYCEPETKVSFSEVQVSSPLWAPYYVFGREEKMAAGTRLRVHAGNLQHAPPEEPGVVRRFIARLSEPGQLRLSPDGANLHLWEPSGNQGHTRRFLHTDVYTKLENAKVLRNADGTGFFLVPSATGSTLEPCEYRLVLTYRRDNRKKDPDSQVFRQAGVTDQERVTIDIPWTAD
jgi:hypothetical protein